MVTTTGRIDAYMRRLRELAAQTDDIGRFFVFQDDELYDLEAELCEPETQREFVAALTAQYESWKSEMGEERWQALLDYNESLSGANQNWFLDDIS